MELADRLASSTSPYLLDEQFHPPR